MKMQNAELGFVTFDAQDVIATSGPTYGSGLAMMVQVAIAYNEDQTNSKLRLQSYTGTPIGSASAKNNTKWIAFDPDSTPLKAQNPASDNVPTSTENVYTQYTEYNDAAYEAIVSWLAQQGLQ